LAQSPAAKGDPWDHADEDISTKNLLLGQPSGESQKSFQKWLNSRMQKVDRVSNPVQVLNAVDELE
jgi:hypothetical protein